MKSTYSPGCCNVGSQCIIVNMHAFWLWSVHCLSSLLSNHCFAQAQGWKLTILKFLKPRSACQKIPTGLFWDSRISVHVPETMLASRSGPIPDPEIMLVSRSVPIPDPESMLVGWSVPIPDPEIMPSTGILQSLGVKSHQHHWEADRWPNWI